MRLMVFSDLHRDVEVARRLAKQSGEADIVVGAGDFATKRKGLLEVIDALAQINRPSILVPGNSESVEELAEACARWPAANVLHGSGVEILGTTFWGMGGAVPVTPFGSWSCDYSEEEARGLLADCPLHAILVSHSPPRGAVDQSSQGENLGSMAIAETVERCHPPLVVCGHVHESAGCSTTVSGTPVVNAGPQGIIWEIPD
ncbi:MAG: metallophosphoesterase family protein [Pirellulaceae bacterium]